MRELDWNESLELYRRREPDPALGGIADLEAALLNDEALARRHRDLEAFDDAVRECLRRVAVPENLQAKVIGKLRQANDPSQAGGVDKVLRPPSFDAPAYALRQPIPRNAEARRVNIAGLRPWHWLVAATLMSAAVLCWNWPFGRPRIGLESLAAEARQVYREILEEHWDRPSEAAIAAAGWPEELSSRCITGVRTVDLAGMRITALRLAGRGQTAVVFLAPRNQFPVDFEFERVDNSGEPVKVLAIRDVAAVVVTSDERGFDLVNPPATLIGRIRTVGGANAA